MYYIIFSILVLFISYHLFKYNSGSMRVSEMNFISFNFYYNLIISSFIGVNIVILELDQHYLLSRITDYSLKQSVYYMVMLVLILMPLTMLIISLLTRFNGKIEWERYRTSEVKYITSKDNKYMFITMIAFTIISSLSIIYTFVTIGSIPLIEVLFNGASDEMNRLRIIASREFDGIIYIRNILAITLTPLLSYIAYTYSKQSTFLGWKILFWYLFISSILIATYSLEKFPVLIYILSFIIINIYIYGRVKLTKIVRYGFIISVLIVLFYMFASGGNNIGFLDYNSGPIGRIVLGQITGLYFHLDYFPDLVPFLKGQSFPASILNFFDIESIRSARLVMEITNPAGIESGIAGVMNTLFVGEAYANFGWVGVVLGIIWVGIVIQLMYIAFLRLPKNPLTIALFTHYTLTLPLTGGFIDFIYNPGMIIVFILVLLIYYIAIFNDKYFMKKN